MAELAVVAISTRIEAAAVPAPGAARRGNAANVVENGSELWLRARARRLYLVTYGREQLRSLKSPAVIL